MSDRPDLDEAANILMKAGWKITGGKYAPTSNNLENELDNFLGQNYVNVDDQTILTEEIAQALQSYITNKERKARIDELERLYDPVLGEHGEPINNIIGKRLANLKQEDNGGE